MRLDPKPVTELASPLAQLPAELARECGDPIALPDRALSRGETLRDWAIDRAALASCHAKDSAAMMFYRHRDTGLAGR